MLNKDIPNTKSVQYSNSKKNPHDTDRGVKMQLRQENMKVSKDKIQTGKVSIHKEVLTEEKNITVPVRKEELVIEKTAFDSQSNDKSGDHSEIIRIPVSKENIHINKEPVILEDISINNHQYEEMKHITGRLKKEIPHVSIKGDVKIAHKGNNKK